MNHCQYLESGTHYAQGCQIYILNQDTNFLNTALTVLSNEQVQKEVYTHCASRSILSINIRNPSSIYLHNAFIKVCTSLYSTNLIDLSSVLKFMFLLAAVSWINVAANNISCKISTICKLYIYSKQPILGLPQECFRELSFSRLECGVHVRLNIYPCVG